MTYTNNLPFVTTVTVQNSFMVIGECIGWGNIDQILYITKTKNISNQSNMNLHHCGPPPPLLPDVEQPFLKWIH